MPDEFRFAISPAVTERNARRLVDVVTEFFRDGATTADLRIKFEAVTTIKRQMFYDSLNYCKYRRWLVGGGHSKPYRLNPNGSWKPPPPDSVGLRLEKEQLEHLVSMQTQRISELDAEVAHLRDWTSGGDANGNGANVRHCCRSPPFGARKLGDDASAQRRKAETARENASGKRLRDYCRVSPSVGPRE